MNLPNRVLSSLILALAVVSQCAFADEASIKTEFSIKGLATAWDPLVLFIQPGDMVQFTNMIGHDTETYEGMIPEGAKPWKSQLGEEGFAVTLDVEGAYIYKCNPHVSLGMIGAIVVGPITPANLEAIEKALPNVKIARNMVQRAIRKMKKAIEKKQAE